MSNLNETKEQNLIRCKVCGEMKLRIQDGMFDHKNKRWRDEKGGLFSGRTCPDCHRKIQAELQRNKEK